jgi:type IV pilus assembly protein PilV
MTLVEVLGALVSASVGLLGVAAIQLVSVRNNQEAYVRLHASALTDDILERIRMNPQGFGDGQYDVDFNGTGTKTSSSIARTDLQTWQKKIDKQLPGGRFDAAGAINRIAGTRTVVVTVRWSSSPKSDVRSASTQGILRTSTEI